MILGHHGVKKAMFPILFVLLLTSILSPDQSFGMDEGSRSFSPPRRKVPSSPLQVTPTRFEKSQNEGWNFLSTEELEASRITAQNGVICWANSLEPLPNGPYLYFLHMNGDFFLRRDLYDIHRGDHGQICHSSFDTALSLETRIGNCRMAGEIELRTSPPRKLRINNDSGHYKPEPGRLQKVEDALRAMGYEGEIIQESVKHKLDLLLFTDLIR